MIFSGVGVDYGIKFTDEKWHYTMFYANSDKGVAMKQKIKFHVTIF